jgi:hypothetical protein
MNKEEIILLDVLLTLNAGYSGIFPEVELIYWLRSAGSCSKLLVIQPKEKYDEIDREARTFEATELTVPVKEVQALGDLLGELKFLERELRVTDTSDPESIWWANLTLQVWINDKARRSQYGLGPDGIVGEDAEGFKRLLRTLLGLGGIRNEWSKLLCN